MTESTPMPAPTPSPAPHRRWGRHVLVAAVLVGVTIPLVWRFNNARQDRLQLANLDAGQPAVRQAAAGWLYAHAGQRPALVEALAAHLADMPPARAAEALHLAALSCANELRMNPQVAQAAGPVLAHLQPEDQLRLLVRLLDASLKAERSWHGADVAAFNQALAAQVGARAAALDPENALRLVDLFEHRAPRHPGVAAGLAAYRLRLRSAQGDAFLKMVGALNLHGHWGADTTDPALYNRWLTTLAQVPGEDTRTYAINLIRIRPGAGDYAELGNTLLRLTRDPAPSVRLQALRAATEWAARGSQAAAFVQAITAAANDQDNAVAREAWLVLGLLHQVPPAPGPLAQVPSPVAEAMFPALAEARPHDPVLLHALVAVLEKNDSQAVSAAHALAHTADPIAQQALADLLAHPTDLVTRQLAQWRALVEGSPAQARLFLQRNPGTNPLTEAAAFVAAQAPPPPAANASDAAKRHRLAALEGLPPASTTLPVPESDLGLAHLAAAKAEQNPDQLIAHLRPLLVSGESVWRDEACLLAARRLDKARATELARDLLATPGEAPKMSGAILCGLAKLYPLRVKGGSAAFLLEHPEWTEEKLYAQSREALGKLGLATVDALSDNANRWRDAKTRGEKGVLLATGLGLALRGDQPMRAKSLLFDHDIPYTTVLLAMLVQEPREALETLLGDDVRTPFARHQLLIEWRYGQLVRSFLPADAPPIRYWGDLRLQMLELERLRAWWRLRKGGFGASDGK